MMAKGETIHICVLCEHPAATYGRLWPCLHTYCLTCAAGLDQCSLCALFSAPWTIVHTHAGFMSFHPLLPTLLALHNWDSSP